MKFAPGFNPFGFPSRNPFGGYGGMGQQFGGGIGPLAPLGKAISRQLNVKRQPEIQEFMGEVKDMANQRFEIDLGAVGRRPMFNQVRPAVIDLMEQQKLTLDTAQEPATSDEAQGYEKGGAAFPDLSGDGKITQKDILIGRGVIKKEYGGPIGMQMGGDPMMAANMPPPQAPPMPMPAPEQPPMPMQDQLDPNIVQSALAQAAGGIGDLDEAQNYEQVMNTMRGDQATVEERREELAGVVGPGDANQTPESVLTLVQPVMMLANVDQGIGQLAQQEMTQPMEGPMAGGIMSTVPEPPMMEAGGTAPVNFNKGGEVRPVQYFQNAGLVSGDVNPFANLSGRLGPLAQQAYEARRSLLGTPEDLEEQKRLTRAQMLFDLAQTGLAFAAPMEGERPGLSAAERLALAARTTQLPERIGQRAQSLLEKKQAQKQRDQAIQLAALTAAETKLEAQKGRESALEIEKLRQSKKKEATVKGIPLSIYNQLSKEQQSRVLLGDEIDIKGIPQSIFKTLTKEQQSRVLVGDEIDIKGIPQSIFKTLSKEQQNRVLVGEEIDIKGIPQSIFKTLTPDEQKRVMLPTGDKIKDIPRDIYEKLTEKEKEKVLDISSNVLDYSLSLDRMFSKFLTEEGENKGLDLANKYGLNQTKSEMNNVINFVIDNFTKDTISEIDGAVVPGGNLPEEWKDAVQRRVALAQNDDTITLPRAYLGLSTTGQAGSASLTPILDNAINQVKANSDIDDVTYDKLIKEIDTLKGVGTPAALGQLVNKTSELLSFMISKPFPNVAKAVNLLEGFNLNAELVIMSSVKGKTDQDMRKRIEARLPQPAQFFAGKEDALDKIKLTEAFFNQEINSLQELLRGPLKLTRKTELQADLVKFTAVRDGYTALRKSFERRFKQIEAGGRPDVDINEFINVNPER